MSANFSYGEDLSDDLDYVRFHTGDVVEGENFLSDNVIVSLLQIESSKQRAVIACLRHIIMRLSTPSFKADWLQVDNVTARAGYETMLAEKKSEFGLGGLVATAVYPYRADSAATEAPDYSDGRPGRAADSDWQ